MLIIEGWLIRPLASAIHPLGVPGSGHGGEEGNGGEMHPQLLRTLVVPGVSISNPTGVNPLSRRRLDWYAQVLN